MRIYIDLDCEMDLAYNYIMMTLWNLEGRSVYRDNKLAFYADKIEGKSQVIGIELDPLEIEQLAERRVKWIKNRKSQLRRAHFNP